MVLLFCNAALLTKDTTYWRVLLFSPRTSLERALTWFSMWYTGFGCVNFGDKMPTLSILFPKNFGFQRFRRYCRREEYFCSCFVMFNVHELLAWPSERQYKITYALWLPTEAIVAKKIENKILCLVWFISLFQLLLHCFPNMSFASNCYCSCSHWNGETLYLY